MWLGVMLDMLASVLDKHASVLDKLASPEEIFDNSCLGSRNLHCSACKTSTGFFWNNQLLPVFIIVQTF